MFPDRPRLRYTKALNPSMSKQSLLDTSGTSSSSLLQRASSNNLDGSDGSDCSSSHKTSRHSAVAHVQEPLRHTVLKRFGSDYFEGHITPVNTDLTNNTGPFSQATFEKQTPVTFSPEIKRKNKNISSSVPGFPPKQLNTDQKMMLSRSKTLASIDTGLHTTPSTAASGDQPAMFLYNRLHNTELKRQKSVLSMENTEPSNGIEFFEPSATFRKKKMPPVNHHPVMKENLHKSGKKMSEISE